MNIRLESCLDFSFRMDFPCSREMRSIIFVRSRGIYYILILIFRWATVTLCRLESTIVWYIYLMLFFSCSSRHRWWSCMLRWDTWSSKNSIRGFCTGMYSIFVDCRIYTYIHVIYYWYRRLRDISTLFVFYRDVYLNVVSSGRFIC